MIDEAFVWPCQVKKLEADQSLPTDGAKGSTPVAGAGAAKKKKGDGDTVFVAPKDLVTIDRVIDFLLNMPFNPHAAKPRSSGRKDEHISILDKMRSWMVMIVLAIHRC